MKKRLLNETAVRKMMKLANIEALTENFLDETNELEETQEVNEEEVNEEEVTEDVAEEGMGAVYDRDDEPMGDDAAADAGPTVSIDVEKLVSDIVAALNAQGADVSVDDGAPADDAPLDDAPMDDAPVDDAPLGDDPMEEEFVAEETVSEDETVNEEETLEEETVEEDLVNEITRRVAQRILQNASN